MGDDLKPCPFCGANLLYVKKAEIWYHPDNYCIISDVTVDKNWIDDKGKTDIERWEAQKLG